MTLAIIIVVIAVLSLAVILSLSVKHSLQASRPMERTDAICPIDLEAFRNLINPAEDQYLREGLSLAQYRMVRRARLRAMAAYVQLAGRNAALITVVAQSALSASDPATAAAAHRLTELALLMRRNATFAMIRIYLAMAWPYSDFAAVRVAERYEQMSTTAMLLGRLQNPATGVRL